MKARTVPPRSLLIFAGEQCDVVTMRQALEGGMTRDGVRGMVHSGRWVRLSSGVFSIGPPTWEQWASAGVVIGGPGSAVGGKAAAFLHGMGPQPEIIDIWAPRGTSYKWRASPHPWDFHRGTRKSIGRPPRLTVEETVLELCSAGGADNVNGWLGKALSDYRTTPDRLRAAIVRAPTLPNRRLILEGIDAVSIGAQSSMEVRYLRDVEKAHGLPRGVRQKSVVAHKFIDVIYEQYKLVVELDGLVGHFGEGENHDTWRDSELLLRGIESMRFGWADVTVRPCEVAAMVAGVLQVRGWDGQMQLCPSCPVPR